MTDELFLLAANFYAIGNTYHFALGWENVIKQKKNISTIWKHIIGVFSQFNFDENLVKNLISINDGPIDLTMLKPNYVRIDLTMLKHFKQIMYPNTILHFLFAI